MKENMDFISAASEIDRLLLECDITAEEVKNISVVVPKPSERKADDIGGRKKLKGVTIKKFEDFKDYKTKESKMEYVAKRIINATSLDFIMEMKKKKWLTIDYTRPYKDSVGGPLFLIGDIAKDSFSITKGRLRLSEINGRFPIYGLTMTLLAKYKVWKREKESKLADIKEKVVDEEDQFDESFCEDNDLNF